MSCEKFTFDRLSSSPASASPLDVAGDGRLHLLTAPYGGVELRSGAEKLSLRAGQSVVVPAAMSEVQATIAPDHILLDMFV